MLKKGLLLDKEIDLKTDSPADYSILVKFYRLQ